MEEGLQNPPALGTPRIPRKVLGSAAHERGLRQPAGSAATMAHFQISRVETSGWSSDEEGSTNSPRSPGYLTRNELRRHCFHQSAMLLENPKILLWAYSQTSWTLHRGKRPNSDKSSAFDVKIFVSGLSANNNASKVTRTYRVTSEDKLCVGRNIFSGFAGVFFFPFDSFHDILWLKRQVQKHTHTHGLYV